MGDVDQLTLNHGHITRCTGDCSRNVALCLSTWCGLMQLPDIAPLCFTPSPHLRGWSILSLSLSLSASLCPSFSVSVSLPRTLCIILIMASITGAKGIWRAEAELRRPQGEMKREMGSKKGLMLNLHQETDLLLYKLVKSAGDQSQNSPGGWRQRAKGYTGCQRQEDMLEVEAMPGQCFSQRRGPNTWNRDNKDMLEENFPYLKTSSSWPHSWQNQGRIFSASYILMKFWFYENDRENNEQTSREK